MTEVHDRQASIDDSLNRPEVRWGVGCLLGSVALLGLMIIAVILAFALSPPTWLQVLIGLGLVGAGVALAWLVATSLERGK